MFYMEGIYNHLWHILVIFDYDVEADFSCKLLVSVVILFMACVLIGSVTYHQKKGKKFTDAIIGIRLFSE